jgi:hypothetical protein
MHTSVATHGFSHGPFATRFLNPQLTRAEGQYSRPITINLENPGLALLHVRRELTNNGVIFITIGAWVGRAVVRAPLFGGWLSGHRGWPIVPVRRCYTFSHSACPAVVRF